MTNNGGISRQSLMQADFINGRKPVWNASLIRDRVGGEWFQICKCK